MKLSYYWICLISSFYLLGCDSQVEKDIDFDLAEVSSSMGVEKRYLSERSSEVFSPRKEMRADSYLNWIKELNNGLRRTKNFEGIKYQVILIPRDYVILKEFKDVDLTQSQINKQNVKFENKTQFLFRVSSETSGMSISKYEVESQAKYDDRIKYLSFQMSEDWYLEKANGDKIPCHLCIYERDYDLSPVSSFSLEFPIAEEDLGDCRLVYTEKIYNHGTIKFQWEKKTLKNLPKLIANE